jgi:Ca2+-binding RTX toxin-like protein
VALNVHVFAVSIGVETDPGDATKLALVVSGSSAGESLVLSPGTGNGVAVSIDVAPLDEFAAPGGVAFGHIIVNAGGGNDVVGLTGGLSVPSLLSGGDGDDTLNAAGSTAVAILIGGAGNDSLFGGSDRDLLIGGLGSDTLSGNGDDDILIGGATDYDANAVALLAIMAEWDSAGVSYSTRLSHLLGSGKGKSAGTGLNGPYLLNSTTVHDESMSDTLTGGSGTDWFFARTKAMSGKDTIADKARSETVTQI